MNPCFFVSTLPPSLSICIAKAVPEGA